MRKAAEIAARLFACLALIAAPHAIADTHLDETPPPPHDKWFVGAFGGIGTNRDYTQILYSPWEQRMTGQDMVGLSFGKEIGSVFDGGLVFELEVLYGFHFGGESYHEFGGAAYARWVRFPWNVYVPTTLGFGIGPNYATRLSKVETEQGHTSKLLNMANLELTFALPDYPDDRLLFRLQHRSGGFGLIDGAREGSNFLMIGYKRYF